MQVDIGSALKGFIVSSSQRIVDNLTLPVGPDSCMSSSDAFNTLLRGDICKLGIVLDPQARRAIEKLWDERGCSDALDSISKGLQEARRNSWRVHEIDAAADIVPSRDTIQAGGHIQSANLQFGRPHRACTCKADIDSDRCMVAQPACSLLVLSLPGICIKVLCIVLSLCIVLRILRFPSDS